jgi:quercetin dioxygenase-like cupin family protein
MAIRLLRCDENHATAVEAYESVAVSSCELAHGDGAVHSHVIHFEPGGVIGPHPAGFDQIFLVARGSGWVAGCDGVRQPLAEGGGAFIPTGETHSKGSETGMTAVMLQATTLSPAPTS